MRNAAPTPVAAAPVAAGATPALKPLIDGAAPEDTKAPLSSCPAGTVLNGLNYIKGKTDPVALPDEDYPEWLWRCLEVKKNTDDANDADAGDEYCKLHYPVTVLS